MDTSKHLDWLESEAIHVIREAVAQFENPVLMFSGGKDSALAALLLEPFHDVTLVTVGFGAVRITYVGLQEFEPARTLERERETPSEWTCRWGTGMAPTADSPEDEEGHDGDVDSHADDTFLDQ